MRETKVATEVVGERCTNGVHASDIVIKGSVYIGQPELALIMEDEITSSPQSQGVVVQHGQRWPDKESRRGDYQWKECGQSNQRSIPIGAS